eukprot:276635-Chlamydomonas_euryale.AAC.1
MACVSCPHPQPFTLNPTPSHLHPRTSAVRQRAVDAAGGIRKAPHGAGAAPQRRAASGAAMQSQRGVWGNAEPAGGG